MPYFDYDEDPVPSSPEEDGGFDFVKGDYLSAPELAVLYYDHFTLEQAANRLPGPSRIGMTSNRGLFLYLEQPGEDLPPYMPLVQSDYIPEPEEEKAGTSSKIAKILKQHEVEEDLTMEDEYTAYFSVPIRSAEANLKRYQLYQRSLVGNQQPSLAIPAAATPEQLVTCKPKIYPAPPDLQADRLSMITRLSEHFDKCRTSGMSGEVVSADYPQRKIAYETTPSSSHFAEIQRQRKVDVILDKLNKGIELTSLEKTSSLTTPMSNSVVSASSTAGIDIEESINSELSQSVSTMDEQKENGGRCSINLTTFEIETELGNADSSPGVQTNSDLNAEVKNADEQLTPAQ